MNLKKSLIASIVLSSSFLTGQVLANTDSFTEVAKQYGEVTNAIPTHVEYISKFAERLETTKTAFTESISNGAIKVAVDKAHETNKDVEIRLDGVQDALKSYLSSVKEISDKANDLPSSVVAKSLSDLSNKYATILEKELSFIPNYETTKDPFISFLKEETKGNLEAYKTFIKEKELMEKFNVGRMDTPVKEGTDKLGLASGLMVESPNPFTGGKTLILNSPKVNEAILQNSFDISNLKLDTEKLKLDVAQNRKEISALRKEQRRGIAQVAAMSSIDFGNVKAHTIKVGAAIGHHKSETALALGVAVAPTNNILINTKAATSTKGKDFTFGVGATYEFGF